MESRGILGATLLSGSLGSCQDCENKKEGLALYVTCTAASSVIERLCSLWLLLLIVSFQAWFKVDGISFLGGEGRVLEKWRGILNSILCVFSKTQIHHPHTVPYYRATYPNCTVMQGLGTPVVCFSLSSTPLRISFFKTQNKGCGIMNLGPRGLLQWGLVLFLW